MSGGHAKQIKIGDDGHRVDVWRDADGAPRCNAKGKRGKETRCGSYPIKGSMRCRVHGGASPRGPAHPNYKHGGRSAWRETLGVPHSDVAEYMDMRDPIDGAQRLADNAARRIHENDTPQFRDRAVVLYESMRDAVESNDGAQVIVAMRELGKLLHRGVDEDRAAAQFGVQLDRLHRYKNDLNRIVAMRGNSVPINEAAGFVARIANMLTEQAGTDVARRVLELGMAEVARTWSGDERIIGDQGSSEGEPARVDDGDGEDQVA